MNQKSIEHIALYSLVLVGTLVVGVLARQFVLSKGIDDFSSSVAFFATVIVLMAIYASLQTTFNQFLLPRIEASLLRFSVSIRPTTGIKPLYTTIATVTMNLIVSAAIVLLNPYVTVYISYKIPPFALSVHIPDVSTSIYVEVDSKVLLGLPFCDKAFVR